MTRAPIRRTGRVPGGGHLLGAAGCPLATPERQREAADDRHLGRRGDGGLRAGEPDACAACCRRGTPGRRSTSTRLGELIDLFAQPRSRRQGPAARGTCSGQVYEYFLAEFASAEGKQGGEFYTPQSVVRLLVEMLAPYRGGSTTLLRLGRHVRPVGEVRRGARRHAGRHLDLRPGIEPDDLAAGKDESRDPADRSQPRAAQRRHVPP